LQVIMSSTPVGIEIDVPGYWDASAEGQRLLAIPNDKLTDEHRERYAVAVSVIDTMGEQIRDGASTGTPVLDRLVKSGQILAPARFEELKMLDAMLVPDEPVLVQDSSKWSVGILTDHGVQFSRVERGSWFADAARGSQCFPVLSYLQVQFSPIMGLIENRDTYGEKIDVRNIEPSDRLPELGPYSGLPVTSDTYGNPHQGMFEIPPALHDAYYDYMNTARRPTTPGRVTWDTLHHIGKDAVEANLGIKISDLLTFADNDALLDYVTQPR
jgi:hypothetical protein